MKRAIILSSNLLVVLVAVFGFSGLNHANAATQTLVPLDAAGDQGNGQLCSPVATSSEGRYVAFSSSSSDLVSSDTNGFCDVFMRDTQAGTTTLESVSTSGVQANKQVTSFNMTRNGRYIVFTTYATNLADGTSTASGLQSIYLRDTQTNTTKLVAGAYYNGDSDDAFYTNGISSEDGRFVFYEELGAPASIKGYYKKDMQLGTTTRVDLAANGTLANGNPNGPISTDCSGRFAAFYSFATNLTSEGKAGMFLVDTGGSSNSIKWIANGDTPLITCDGNNLMLSAGDSANLVPGDNNGISDFFEYNIARGTFSQVSTDSSGNEYTLSECNSSTGCPNRVDSISMDGRYVALNYPYTVTISGQNYGYNSEWIKDTYTGALTELSQSGNNTSLYAAVSADAREAYYYYQSASGQPSKLYVATDYL